MLRYALTVLLLLLGGVGNAQQALIDRGNNPHTSLSINYGYGYSTLGLSNEKEKDNYFCDVTITAGIQSNFHKSPWFLISLGFNYSRKGYNYQKERLYTVLPGVPIRCHVVQCA